MARTARLTPRFLARRASVGALSGSEVSKAIGRVIATLAGASVLPGALDYEAAIPPVTSAFVRRVPGQNLWIWYRFDDDSITLINVTDTPPLATN
jgi:hypothetical protein